METSMNPKERERWEAIRVKGFWRYLLRWVLLGIPMGLVFSLYMAISDYFIRPLWFSSPKPDLPHLFNEWIVGLVSGIPIWCFWGYVMAGVMWYTNEEKYSTSGEDVGDSAKSVSAN
jgi:hypothetical protein